MLYIPREWQLVARNPRKHQERAKWGEKRVIFKHYAFKYTTPFFTAFQAIKIVISTTKQQL